MISLKKAKVTDFYIDDIYPLDEHSSDNQYWRICY